MSSRVFGALLKIAVTEDWIGKSLKVVLWAMIPLKPWDLRKSIAEVAQELKIG